MESTPLQIKILNGFSILREGAELNISGRSRKLCLLMAYLIWERGRPVPFGELTGLLWEEQEAGSLNALKALIHRARACLDQLGRGAGRSLLLSREGCYQWNPDVPLTVDAEEFSRLCRAGGRARSSAARLNTWMEALALYPGDLLPNLAGHPWAAPKAEALHQLYVQTALDALPLLSAQDRWEEAAQLSAAVLVLEPCREDLCRWQMEALLRLDRRREAAQAYEDLQERLLTQLGVLPSDALREFYQQLPQDGDSRIISPANLLERLQEPPRPGALMCGYDFFRTVCHSMARLAGRSGEPLHVALISVTSPKDTLPRYSLDRAMDNLEGIILVHLRRGDAAARCSASQFVLLLPQASYENAQMVCSRITRAFNRQFPHSPASLQVSVQPLLAGS